MSESSELAVFKFRRLLKRLASKVGRGTELISLYVPPGKQVSDVISYLRREYGTAANIKSKTTRKNVQDALSSVIQRVKLFKRVPENGLCVFCGMIPQGPPGSERMEMYVFTPIEPVSSFIYRCDDHFLLSPLQEIAKEEEENYGIVVLDTQAAAFALLRKKRLEMIETITSGIAGKHRAGGQSAQRFERLRKMEVLNFFRRISKYIDKIYLKVPNLQGLIIGGPGPTKNDFLGKSSFNYRLREKVIGTVDTGYADEEGVKEAIEQSRGILENMRYVREREAVQRFLGEIGRDTGLAIYGEDVIREGLKRRRVKTLLLSEDLNLVRVKVRCSQCDFSEVKDVEGSKLFQFEQSVESERCPVCQSDSLKIAKEEDLVEDLMELGEKSGADVKIISTQTEEGVMLKKSFSGLAAILKTG